MEPPANRSGTRHIKFFRLIIGILSSFPSVFNDWLILVNKYHQATVPFRSRSEKLVIKNRVSVETMSDLTLRVNDSSSEENLLNTSNKQMALTDRMNFAHSVANESWKLQ